MFVGEVRADMIIICPIDDEATAAAMAEVMAAQLEQEGLMKAMGMSLTQKR